MNQQLKQHINNINKGIIPKGYKKTKLGIIPEEWDIKKYSEAVEIKVGRDLKEENYSKLKTENHLFPVFSNTVDNYGLYGYYNFPEYNGKSLTIVGRGVGLGTAFPREGGFGAIGRLLVLFPNDKVDENFLSEYTNFKVRFFTESSGIPQLTGVQLAKIKIPLPPLPEQQKIANILTTWDKAIELKEQLIEQKQAQKKGFMQNLLTGKVRLKGFTEEWKEVKLGDYVIEINTKTTKRNEFPVLSSSKSGIYLQSEYFKKEVASENNIGYKIINRGNFTYRSMSDTGHFTFNIQNLLSQGIISPAYPVFENKEDLIDKYFLYIYLNNTDHIKKQLKMLKEGGTRYALSYSKFVKLKIFLPSLSEQKAISEIIIISEKEIALLNQELESLKEQKKCLMQLLLTGKVRVKV